MLRGSIASATHFDTSTASENGSTWSRLPVISNRMTASVTERRVTPHMTAPAQTYQIFSLKCFGINGSYSPTHKLLARHKLMEILQPGMTQTMQNSGICLNICWRNPKIIKGERNHLLDSIFYSQTNRMSHNSANDHGRHVN